MPTPQELAAEADRIADAVAALGEQNAARIEQVIAAARIETARTSAAAVALVDAARALADQIGALPAAGFTPAYPLDVPDGVIRFGAGVGGNSDPYQRHEVPAGAPLGIRRTFFGSGDVAKTVNMAKADFTAGRASWLSTKTPPWAEVTKGLHDAWIDQLLVGLQAVGANMWLTPWHEPENDPSAGTAADWRGMVNRFLARARAVGATNVQIVPILMSWTFNPASGLNPADWMLPVADYPLWGLDHYNKTESKDIDELPAWVLAYQEIVVERGHDLAVGEWGNRGEDTRTAQEMRDFAEWAAKDPKVKALSYFDSGLNSPSGSWELKGEPLTEFHRLVGSGLNYHDGIAA